MNARELLRRRSSNLGADDRFCFDRRRRRLHRLYRFRRGLPCRVRARPGAEPGPPVTAAAVRVDGHRRAGRARDGSTSTRCWAATCRLTPTWPTRRSSPRWPSRLGSRLRTRRSASSRSSIPTWRSPSAPIRWRAASIRATSRCAVRRCRPAAWCGARGGHRGQGDHRAGCAGITAAMGLLQTDMQYEHARSPDRLAQARRRSGDRAHQRRDRRTGRSLPARPGKGWRERRPAEIHRNLPSAAITARASNCAPSCRTAR